jgi:hypothetical protein
MMSGDNLTLCIKNLNDDVTVDSLFFMFGGQHIVEVKLNIKDHYAFVVFDDEAVLEEWIAKRSLVCIL